MYRLILCAALLATGCAHAWQDDFDRLKSEVDAASVAPADADADVEALLAGPLDLETLLRAARARSPELREAVSRTHAGIEEVRRAGALDDPMLKIETMGVPLRHAGSFNRAENNMIGLSQTIPFPGNLGLRSEAALRGAGAAHQMYRERERDVILRVKKAYFEYGVMTKELEIHREHVKIMEDFEKISDAKFRTGAVTQQDVLKPQVELVMLHSDILAIEQKIGSARAELNRILNRPPQAPLGDPREIEATAETFDLPEIASRAAESRPEVRAARLMALSSKASLDLAEREASLPDFSFGVDYWQVPGEPDAWAGMISINLPWLFGKRPAEARKMRHLLRADETAIETATARVLFEARNAWLRVEAARKALELFRTELLPKSNQSVDVSRAAYRQDKASFLDLLDAERSNRDVKLGHARALAQYEAAVADLERAAGFDLRRKP